ncbi:hypothetical protein A2716_04100 [candidate division WWE3 bacterium RIFCSPHIGHO2_01_FULL_40_23]|uniref:Uncharacterized protein n=1 Tax=candidate division WWE3 bacterium RIFCSPLOWO2_01_FULL_41_18 TaxID=1802625 RepID=A0A1F4VDM1_UNCKA|nr:MAG: hypothetical protein A2716_04100 [candidate division WWE3 bacterium RIFCSPHIGHO2_01_FULL_40_23]OGC55058.1 MAG: hypothetical protein A3A78_03710 [candidate division WWE3 bacterium RIFCSPLOWO2_01_FULL_41_18]
MDYIPALFSYEFIAVAVGLTSFLMLAFSSVRLGGKIAFGVRFISFGLLLYVLAFLYNLLTLKLKLFESLSFDIFHFFAIAGFVMFAFGAKNVLELSK